MLHTFEKETACKCEAFHLTAVKGARSSYPAYKKGCHGVNARVMCSRAHGKKNCPIRLHKAWDEKLNSQINEVAGNSPTTTRWLQFVSILLQNSFPRFFSVASSFKLPQRVDVILCSHWRMQPVLQQWLRPINTQSSQYTNWLLKITAKLMLQCTPKSTVQLREVWLLTCSSVQFKQMVWTFFHSALTISALTKPAATCRAGVQPLHWYLTLPYHQCCHWQISFSINLLIILTINHLVYKISSVWNFCLKNFILIDWSINRLSYNPWQL